MPSSVSTCTSTAENSGYRPAAKTTLRSGRARSTRADTLMIFIHSPSIAYKPILTQSTADTYPERSILSPHLLPGRDTLRDVDMRRIVAMGGGGFSMEPDNPLLDEFVLSLARSPRPSVCFLPTASGDADSYTAQFYRAFAAFDCKPTDLR